MSNKLRVELESYIEVRVPDRARMKGARADGQRFDRSRQDEFAGHSDQDAKRHHRRTRPRRRAK